MSSNIHTLSKEILPSAHSLLQYDHLPEFSETDSLLLHWKTATTLRMHVQHIDVHTPLASHKVQMV